MGDHILRHGTVTSAKIPDFAVIVPGREEIFLLPKPQKTRFQQDFFSIPPRRRNHSAALAAIIFLLAKGGGYGKI